MDIDTVVLDGVVGNLFNSITKRYEVTDHTFVVGHWNKNKGNETQQNVIQQMSKDAEKVIAELNTHTRVPDVMQVRKKGLTDVARVTKLLTDKNMEIAKLSEKTGIPQVVLCNYRDHPENLKDAQNDEIAYNSVYELYKMCHKANWHHLAKMEEVWRAFYCNEVCQNISGGKP